MTMKIKIALLIMSLSIVRANGQGFLHVHGTQIIDGNGDTVLLRGIGLGGWMLQEGYMLHTSDFAGAQHEIREKIEELIGTENTDTFYNSWLSNYIRKADIDTIKAWGFNSVRLPMHYNLFTLPVQDEPVPGENTWLSKGFELTDSLLSWCRENEVYLILDLHAAPGGQGHDEPISDYNPAYPSLWESADNRHKTVALWKKLAERYANESWIGGYDLINEPNWELTGNTLLKQLYIEITDSIRAADTSHIVFIEGNWFANDFTGLSVPWDANMVYSPHKYWNYNDIGSIQWMLNLRNNSNLPVWLGESGENSNTWFRDAITLLEEYNIGWAWWPWKKISSVIGPVSVIMTDEYQELLDYWNRQGTQPGAEAARETLMELTENLRLENCIIHKDVRDAMFRQINSELTKPFNDNDIPGIIYATDFDLGPDGIAYSDEDVATYHSSTGVYTAWNAGWSYRNDGVDIEECEDAVHSNGYNVGWISDGEWMQYEANIDSSAVYDVNVRTALQSGGGLFHLMLDNADICSPVSVPATGGWQSWQILTIHDVVLDSGNHKLKFYADKGGYNLNCMEFLVVSATTDIETAFISARTQSNTSIEVTLNKPIQSPLPPAPSGFIVYAGGVPLTINETALDESSPHKVIISINEELHGEDEIKVSYTGDQVLAQDGTLLTTFAMEDVMNMIPVIHSIPGKIEAEDFFFQKGISTETTTDAGGGLNIGYTDIGDYMDYYIVVADSGSYIVNYRIASLDHNGGLQLQLVDSTGMATTLHTVVFSVTGGWQSWTTAAKSVVLPRGFHILRLLITRPSFNLNWFEINEPASAIGLKNEEISLNIYPNPCEGRFSIEMDIAQRENVEIQIYNNLGMAIIREELKDCSGHFIINFDLSVYPSGIYYLQLIIDNNNIYRKIIIK
jgi:endoglucanase